MPCLAFASETVSEWMRRNQKKLTNRQNRSLL
jgi:hypothetical protein